MERDIEDLGFTSVVSRDITRFNDDITSLCEGGIDFKIISDGKVIKENLAKDYIPLGMDIEIDNRIFRIDRVDYDYNEVSLQDITFANNTGFPIFRSERIGFVRSFIEDKLEYEKQLSNENSIDVTETKVDDIEVLDDDIDFDFDNATSRLTFEKPKEKEETIQDNSPKINFIITDNQLGVGTPKEKFNNNITAIKTLQLIESENRRATPEEQEILSKYVGFGGLADAFDDSKTNWSNEYNTLKNLLTDDEYKSARGSTLNAHYTAPIVINSMYEALEKMGVPREVNILESSYNTRNFFVNNKKYKNDALLQKNYTVDF